MILGMCSDFWPSPLFCITDAIIGRLGTKLAQWSFFDANLTLQLMAAFNTKVHTEVFLTLLSSEFLYCLTHFSYSQGILILYEHSRHGITLFYTTFD